jgi:23S rRNA pseudouridine2605 synthase
MERLQKIIAQAGICSRRKAEELISEGRVSVNGKVITELGFKADISDKITVDNKPIFKKEKLVYLVLNKPRNTVATVKDDRGRKTVLDCIENVNKRIYPVGRLDYDTTGVLLLTNDGDLANKLTHPSSEIDKVYIATIKGEINKDDLAKLEEGVEFDGKKSSPCKAVLNKYNKDKDKSIVELTIHEGRNHQVRKMFEALGYQVLKLKREKYANLDLRGLKPGEYRKLTNKEIAVLYSMVK